MSEVSTMPEAEEPVEVEEPLSANALALVQMYELVMGQINAIDVELESATGGKAAGRRAIINGLKKSNEGTINEVIDSLRTQLFESDNFTDEQKAAVYFGLVEGLKSQFEEKSVSIVEPMVESRPEAPPIPAEQLSKMTADRSEAFKQVRHVRELLSMFGANVENYPMPKRRGGGGKRGVRETFQVHLDSR